MLVLCTVCVLFTESDLPYDAIHSEDSAPRSVKPTWKFSLRSEQTLEVSGCCLNFDLHS